MPEILAADIGATNSRFAHFRVEEGELILMDSVWLASQEVDSFAQLLAQLDASDMKLTPGESDAVSLALAGPVQDGVYCQPPHIAWDVDLERDGTLLGPGLKLLMNDFVAQAFASRTPVMAQAEQILPGQVDDTAALGVIGAGSNLGHAALLPDPRGGHVALASEGGHGAFAFQGEREFEYMAFLSNKVDEPYPTGDTVVSGRGLSLLHEFLTGDSLEPAQVARKLGEDSETLQWMARLYGRACRQWALQVVALGGLYIAGGLAARVPVLVRHPAFAAEFLRSASMERLLQQIPVFLNRDQNCGLWGAALAALERLKAG